MRTTREDTGHLVTRAVAKVPLARVEGGRVHRVDEVTIDWDLPAEQRVRTKPHCGRPSHRYVEVHSPVETGDLCQRCFPGGAHEDVLEAVG